MRVNVFISESRISKKKYVEEFKPKQRLEYLSKYPKSSFTKFTDAKGKITDGKKPKAKLSGKPKAPKTSTTPKKKRNPVSKALAKRLTSSIDNKRQANSVKSALAKINEGTATKQTLNSVKRRVPEEFHDEVDKAFNKSRKNSKAAVETRRKDISEKPKKKVAKKPTEQKTPAKKKVAKKPKAKPAQPEVEKPSTQDSAKVIQKVPKAQRGSMMETMKRVFGRKATEQDIQKIEKAKKGMDKTSRESLDKLKRYAEAGIIGKKEEAEKPKTKSRKKLTKRQLYDRIRDKDLPKITKYRENETTLKDEFKVKARAIADGKGTKDQRRAKYDKLKKAYVAKLKRNSTLANNLIAKTRERMVAIKEDTERKDGF